MKLTENFTLDELTVSNPPGQNVPTAEIIENLKALAVNVLQPIRDHFKVPVIVTSGYRTPEYNKKIGGATASLHMKGQAVDIDLGDKNSEVFWWIVENLDFDQTIWEFGTTKNPDWIHIAYKNKGNRKMVTRAVKKNSRTEYHIIPIK